MSELTISAWNKDHPHWPKLTAIIEQLGQMNWVTVQGDWHLSSVLLVACIDEKPVGFLRYVIQEIGVDEDLDVVRLGNKPLREAKVLAFGVVEHRRRQGIGTQLQQALIENSRQAGCYQVRSHSSLSNKANHQLKLSLGFGVHPLPSTSERGGFYFVLPL